MPVYTLDDVVEFIADQVGRFGAHPEGKPEDDACNCRVCWAIGIKGKILEAVEVDRKLAAK